MKNTTLKVDNLDKITVELLHTAINLALGIGITSTALLGSAGDTIILFDNRTHSSDDRVSQVSVRLHNSHVELLLTNPYGEFLFYGKYHKNLGIHFITHQFKQTFDMIGKQQILSGTILKNNSHYRSLLQQFIIRLFKIK